MSGNDSDGGGIMGGVEDFKGSDRKAARMARFNNRLAGNRYKELEAPRAAEREAWIAAGGDRTEMRGTCEGMCAEYEREFRDYTSEVHPLEARADDKKRIDHDKAVAAYTRSDAGAGHGEAAKLPSDLRTPAALVRSIDYLFNTILSTSPPGRPDATPRMALGYTAGFIRDRTRAIRKEFAMQSIWGQEEAIASFERIARWHILCLRELQEQTGINNDMHIDSSELGRCFTSLRQQYNDRREELGIDMPCPNEPEFRAYMLIFDLTQRGTATACAEVPAVILDHPNVRLAWKMRRTAQRNFDSQKEGSKQNAEYGSNMITAYTRLLKTAQVPFLLSCLAEIRLRELRRSALRALRQSYFRPKESAQSGSSSKNVVSLSTLAKILGCEELEAEPCAWEDVDDAVQDPEAEAADVAKAFGLEVLSEEGKEIGVLMARSLPFNDNKDAPYTRRWALITARQADAAYGDIISGKVGVLSDPNAPVPSAVPRPRKTVPAKPLFQPKGFTPAPASAPAPAAGAPSAFSFGGNRSASGFGGMVAMGERKPRPTQGGLGLSFKSPSVEPGPKQVLPPSGLSQSTSAFGGTKPTAFGAFGAGPKTTGFAGFGGGSAFGGTSTAGPAGAFGGLGAAGKPAAKPAPAPDTPTPKAVEATSQVFAFKVPAIPEHRKASDPAPEPSAAAPSIATSSTPTFSSPAQPKPEPKLETSATAADPAVPQSKPFFTLPQTAIQATETVADDQNRESAKRSRDGDTDVQEVLAKPSFFAAPKAATPPVALTTPAAPAELPPAPAAITAAPAPLFQMITPAASISSPPVTASQEKAPSFSVSTPPVSISTTTPVAASSASTATPAAIANAATDLSASQLRASLTKSSLRGRTSQRPRLEPIRLDSYLPGQAADKLVDTIIAETISALLDKHVKEIDEYTKTRAVIKDYQRQLAQRRKVIDTWSSSIFHEMVREYIENICEDAVDVELDEREEDMEAAEERRRIAQQRAEEAQRLSDSIMGMGFGGQSVILTPQAPSWTHARLPGGSEYGSPTGTGKESDIEVQFDFELHQAHQRTESFFRPASLLRTIGRHVHDLAPAFGDNELTSNVVISLTTDSPKPTAEKATEWLISKLSPPDGDDELVVNGSVTLASQAVGRYDAIEMDEIGLYVFEAPVLSGRSKEDEAAIGDAQDRLKALIDHVGEVRTGNPYPAVLLITAWTDEMSEGLLERFDIGNDVACFDTFAIVSLQQVESLDDRFERAVEEAFADLEIKSELRIPLDRLAPELIPQWLRFTATIGDNEQTHCTDASFAAKCLSTGLETLDHIHDALNRASKDRRVGPSNTYDAFRLPLLDETTLNTETSITLFESLIPYFADEVFEGLNDVDLCLARMRDAAYSNQALPITQLLSALGGLIFGELAEQSVCFRHYDSADAIRKEINLFQRNAISAFRSYSDDAINKVKSAAAEVRPAAGADVLAQRAPASATQSAPSEASQATPARQSLKRHVSTDTLNEMSPAKIRDSKKARNDRLWKAIRAAQGTIQDMAVQRVEEQDVMELDEFGVGGVSIFA